MRTRSRRPGGSHAESRGFTLIELLVVIFIILLISVVALPTVLPALNHRQVSEAARILQGALVGARDKAIHDNQPCGIRLMPDPAFPLQWVNGQVNPYSILAYNRAIPLESAPEYSEGNCTPYTLGNINYLASLVPGITITNAATLQSAYPSFLILFESLADPKTGAPNSPTSWYWNIRVGDKIQLNNAGPWYTVMGPLVIPQFGGTVVNGTLYANPDGFVNVGPPAAISQASNVPVPSIGNQPLEFLVLVNGQDDNNNGWVDEGFDGVDNNNDGIIDNFILEYEKEEWLGTLGSITGHEVNVPYTIRRRPAPAPNAREIALPTDIVIDATAYAMPNTPHPERSRLPVDPYSGFVDIIINPDGTVLPITAYSTPASFQMGSSFYHFWLAERQDLNPVQSSSNGTAQPWAPGASYYLPIAEPSSSFSSNFPGPYLKGEYSVLTLFTRTGQIVVNSSPPFVNQFGYYHSVNPFIQAEQGVVGGP